MSGQLITTAEQLTALPAGTILVDHDVTTPNFYDLVVVSKSGVQDRFGTWATEDLPDIFTAGHGGALRIVEMGSGA